MFMTLKVRRFIPNFQNAAFTAIPDGVVPDEKIFPAIADVTLVVDEYRDKEGITRYRPNVKAINFLEKG